MNLNPTDPHDTSYLPSVFEQEVVQLLGELSRTVSELKAEIKILKASSLAVSHKTSILYRDRKKSTSPKG